MLVAAKYKALAIVCTVNVLPTKDTYQHDPACSSSTLFRRIRTNSVGLTEGFCQAVRSSQDL